MFQRVDYIVADTVLPGELTDWHWRELRTYMKFDGEAYLKSHQDVYTQLPERRIAEMLYGAYHQFLDDKQLPQVNSRVANLLLAYAVESNQLQHRYIKKFLVRAAAEELLKRLHSIYEDSERLRKIRSGTTEPKDRK
jgi:hypothetical protein